MSTPFIVSSEKSNKKDVVRKHNERIAPSHKF